MGCGRVGEIWGKEEVRFERGNFFYFWVEERRGGKGGLIVSWVEVVSGFNVVGKFGVFKECGVFFLLFIDMILDYEFF